MRINKSKIIISIIVFLLVISLWLPTHATGIDATWRQAGRFIQTGESADVQTFNGTNVKEAAMGLYDFFWWIGLAAAAIIGTFLGIKFMTSGIEGKAKVKEALIVFVVGCIVIFGAFTIWKIAMKLFNEVEEETKTAGYVASNPSSTGTVFSVDGCGFGKHAMHYYYEHDCSKCNAHCDHDTMTEDGQGKRTCTKCGMTVMTCKAATQVGGRGGDHEIDVTGRCKYCGWQCEHEWETSEQYHKCKKCGYFRGHVYKSSSNSLHACKTCGYSKNHTFSGTSAQCSEANCGFVCGSGNHNFYNAEGGMVGCKNCNYLKKNCLYESKGTGAHGPTASTMIDGKWVSYCSTCGYVYE